ncbi:hypothetical protein GY45DRAFT_1092462 [Cubamyces sp. BRFM 1775]|nr:hypothetical protein GY45DRAFT_1092462 [Cubamyces sp. BRFM 1775]
MQQPFLSYGFSTSTLLFSRLSVICPTWIHSRRTNAQNAHRDIKSSRISSEAMPNVGHIARSCCIPEKEKMQEGYPLTDNYPIVLPRLRVLELEELARDIARVLQMIAIPPTARMVLKGLYDSVYPERIAVREVLRGDIIPYDLHQFPHFRGTQALELTLPPPIAAISPYSATAWTSERDPSFRHGRS